MRQHVGLSLLAVVRRFGQFAAVGCWRAIWIFAYMWIVEVASIGAGASACQRGAKILDASTSVCFGARRIKPTRHAHPLALHTAAATLRCDNQ